MAGNGAVTELASGFWILEAEKEWVWCLDCGKILRKVKE